MSISYQQPRSGDPRKLAARLNKRIAIEQPVYTTDAAGGGTTSWANVATLWGEIRSRNSGGESLFGGKLAATISHVITIRYRDDVTSKMRASYDGRLFNIRRIDNVDAANVMLELYVEEGVAI